MGRRLSERRGSSKPVSAAPRLRRPRLPHRSGQCGGARNAAAASLAGQRGGGDPPEAAPPAGVLAGGSGDAGRAAGLGAGSRRRWVQLGGSGPYLISLPVLCAVPRWVLRLPSLFVRSFCSFISSPTGSAWVLCAIRISKLRPEFQRSAGSAAPVLNGMSQSGDLQNAHPPHTSTPTTHALHLLHANKSIER